MEVDTVDEGIDGSIHSVHVRNFFCHDNLEINFNKNVNFIVGRNGSGKSAILTALVVGLGGRASATNRGSNLHSFIKKGANSATIEIKIKNNTTQAYKHNIYGDYITVVRTINASGGSSYKVKSASGEVISTKFEEVNAITQALGIQVDNPISVLNQDDARSFHASDARKKYSLFRRATNLDQTEQNYNVSLENCKKAMTALNIKSDACSDLEKEFKMWKASYEQLQSRNEIEAKKQALQNEYYWSEILELERKAISDQSQYDHQYVKAEKLQEKLNKTEENIGNNSNAIETLKKQLDESKLQKTALEQEMRGLEEELRGVQTSWRAAQSASNKHMDVLNREKRKVTDLEREIHNIESGGTASRRSELERGAAAASAAAAAARARYGTAQLDAEQARGHAAAARAAADHAAAAAAAHRNTIKQLKQQLRELESRGNETMAVYGNNMVELCQLLNKVKEQFSEPPRGPVGAYLKVKEKKWAGALEHIIGGAITSFCVNTPEDSRKLFELMNKVYGAAAKPSVTCSKFLARPHDVRRSAVRARGLASALDALHVRDAVVANYLIDNLGLETVLMVPEHEDAMRLTDNVENVPANCAKVVTLDCTEYYPAPNYRCYGGAARPGRYLHVSTADRKRQLQIEIQEAEAKLKSLEAEAERLNAEARQAREHERSTSRTLEALLAERYEKDEAERVAKSALDQQQAPHHTVLVDELKVSNEKLKKLNEELQEISKKEQQLKEKINECEAKMKQLKAKLGQKNSSCRKLNEEIEQEQLRVDHGAMERQSCRQRLKEEKAKLAQMEKILEEKKAVILKKIEAAEKLCPRIENARDKSVVEVELQKTQKKLSSIRKDGLSKAQVLERLLEVEQKYRNAKHTLVKLNELVDVIKTTADVHLQRCYETQVHVARLVQHSFQLMLNVRNYSGDMHIDNIRGVLEIHCTGRESSSKRHASSTSSLSGGERSYSTVAFIMALWDCVEMPFYFMDEFDVFMDNVNRKTVMELLIDYAKKNSNRQFVFLTPQDASSVTAGPNIKIHLMAAPRP